MNKEIYISITKNPIYDANVKENIHVRFLSESKNNILSNLKLAHITSIVPCNLPVQIPHSPNVVNVSPFIVSCDEKNLYVLEFEISNTFSTYISIACSTSSEHIIAIATDWFDDESAGLFDYEFESMIEQLDKFGRYEFEGHEKHLKILIYYFDLQKEVID